MKRKEKKTRKFIKIKSYKKMHLNISVLNGLRDERIRIKKRF